MGTHLWVADGGSGFCRLDPAPVADGTFAINVAFCTPKTIKSPAQPVFDAATSFLYLPDSAGQGVWRLPFDSVNETLGTPVLLAGGCCGLAGNNAQALALGPDGNLYVGFGHCCPNVGILRISNPAGATQTVQTIGSTASAQRTLRLAFAGADLYLAEPGAVTTIPNAIACTPAAPCKAAATSVSVRAPLSIASDGANVLYIGNGSAVFRFSISVAGCPTGVQDVLANTGTNPDGTTTGFTNVSAAALDSAGNLLAGDDPSSGTSPGLGHIWQVAAGSAPLVAGACGAPAQPPQPAAPPAATNGTLYASGLTAPAGAVWIPGGLGGHLWVSDGAAGFCRLDPQAPPAPAGTFAINAAVCTPKTVKTPGQAAFDPAASNLYISDGASGSPSVWRLPFDSANEVIPAAATAVAMAAGSPLLVGNRAEALALGSDGNLYVGFKKNATLVRITTPAAASQTASVVGTSSDGKANISQVAFAGPDLYLVEPSAVTIIAGATACAAAAPCKAAATPISVVLPQSVASDGTHVFVGTGNTVARYTISTAGQIVLASAGTNPDGTTTSFSNVSAVGLDPAGNLFAGDDSSLGNSPGLGHTWKVAPVP